MKMIMEMIHDDANDTDDDNGDAAAADDDIECNTIYLLYYFCK